LTFRWFGVKVISPDGERLLPQQLAAPPRREGAVPPSRLIVAITGATGTTYGVRLLEILADSPVETHLVMCPCSWPAIRAETGRDPAAVRELADRAYRPSNQAARISSGSFLTEGMVIAPCSLRTVSRIVNGLAGNLVQRAADVVLKEGRRLVLAVGEPAAGDIQLANLRRAAELPGVVVAPLPLPGTEPADLVVGRLLERFGVTA
jgi:flavin prenyltransferase